MKKISEKIVFFGSGPVAASCLELLTLNFEIEAVISKPAKSRVNDPVPVIDLAKKLNIKTFTPSNKIELDSLIRTSPVQSKLAILIDYGIIVTQEVIDYFPLGIVNSHFSLLPKWRGADPITFSILSGDNITGVSLMMITAGMDEGPLLAQGKLNIKPTSNSISLTNELVKLSNDLLVKFIPKYIENTIKPTPQPSDQKPTYSRKLTKLDGQISWGKSAERIEREIRGFIEWPKSYTKIKDKDIIITAAHVVNKKGEVGSYVIENSTLYFFCGENALSIDKLKPAGKNEMEIGAFLLGYGSKLI